MVVSSIEQAERPIIALTVGDPAGIGPEIVIKALAAPAMYANMRPLVFADRAVLLQTLEMLGETMELREVQAPSDGHFRAGCVDFIDAGVLSEPVTYGEVSAACGTAGYTYLDRAIDAALAGEVDALATAPLNKESLQAAELPYIDHTAVLKARAALHEPMTLFLVKNLKIFF